MDMSIPYESTGRSGQKMRTRSALVAAARQLLAEGVTPTVERTADRAAISRTTAFRYFPNLRALMVATYPQIEEQSLLGTPAPEGAMDRLDAVTESITRDVVEYEPELRAQLHLALEPGPKQPDDLPLRQGRGIGWIKEALSPLQEIMPTGEIHRVALAIRATIGIEALVWLTDIAGVSREEAVNIMRSSARSILRCAIEDADAAAPHESSHDAARAARPSTGRLAATPDSRR